MVGAGWGTALGGGGEGGVGGITGEAVTGYLIKIQLIQTALDLPAYWDQIKATTLNYDVEETTFKADKALHLKLSDSQDYPGNRYLIKHGQNIFDVWYAIPSPKFSEDDLKRAQKMLESLVLN